jgi:hypothetical protein
VLEFDAAELAIMVSLANAVAIGFGSGFTAAAMLFGSG